MSLSLYLDMLGSTPKQTPLPSIEYVKRVLVWFSCGAASAVAAKFAIDKYKNKCEVVYCNTLSTEREDNLRFFSEVQQWLGCKIKIIKSSLYTDINDVFIKTRYMSGVYGARGTTEMKKKPREQYQQEGDIHVFGFTADEQSRIDKFKNNNDLHCDWILRDSGITKEDCYAILNRANISLPKMYEIGFDHNNCIGCVKSTSIGYWSRVRKHFPEVFKLRCEQSRELGVRLIKINGVRHFLDELPEEIICLPVKDDAIECGVVCQTPLE